MTDACPRRRALWIPVLTAAILNALLFAGIELRNPGYFRHRAALADPDAQGYYTIGVNLFEHGAFSRAEEPPYPPDNLRTPLFPLLVGVLNQLGGLAAVHLGGAAMHVLSCALLYLLADAVFGPRAALAASMFLATDAVLVSCNFTGMSESTFLAPLLGSLVLFVTALQAPAPPRRLAGRILAAGLLLGVATLVRPTSLYLGGAFALALAVRFGRSTSRRAGLGLAAVALVASLILPGTWAARNWALFRIPKVTPVDTHNMVYWFGAAGYQEALGLELYDAQARIAREFHIPPYVEAQNYWLASEPPAELERRLHDAIPSVLAKYPGPLAIGCVKGVLKATVSHSASLVGQLLAMPWRPPTMAGLARFDAAAWGTLRSNGPLLAAVFFWQLLHTAVAWLAAAIGLVRAWRGPYDRVAAAFLALVFAYLYATIAMFGLEAFFRCRIPMLPLLDLFAGVGAAAVYDRLRQRRCRTSTPAPNSTST